MSLRLVLSHVGGFAPKPPLEAGDSISRAATALIDGRLVAFPTETVYGLGARADRADAVQSIFRAKGRPATNPCIVHVASVEDAERLAIGWSNDAAKLARAFWPGPLTLVVRRREGMVADEACAFGPTVAVRVPGHPIALALLEAARVPVAAPSANVSGSISPTTAEHVIAGLGDRIDFVIDGGPTRVGIESTIVDVSADRAVLLRPGGISLEAIAEHCDVIDGTGAVVSPGTRAAAPGMHERHYAPRAKVEIVASDELASFARARANDAGERVGAIVFTAAVASSLPSSVAIALLPSTAEGFATELYAALHRLDDAEHTTILVEAPPDDAAWRAVRDRLRRAAR